jgi:hypothetical protein
MARETTGVGRWREGGSSRRPARTGPTSAKKWLGTAIVSALLVAAAGAFGWLMFQIWFATGPRPYFLAFWVGPYDRPEIPPIAWLDADRGSLKEDRVFTNVDPRYDGSQKTTLELMQRRLEDLAARPRDEDMVVYLSAYAVVDHDKKIQIMAADSTPYAVKTQLSLSWVLDRLKSCPAKNKLLVLDIMRGMIDPRDVGGTADGVGDLIAGAIQDAADASRLNDPDLIVIAACGPGQKALASESLRHSVFGYFFHRALTSREADGDGNGAVSVRELGGYLSRTVDAWAMHYRGVHQVPVLLGRPQGDFALAAARWPAAPAKAGSAGTPPAEPKAGETPEAKGKELAGEEKDKAKAAAPEAAESKPAAGKAGDYPAWLEQSWTLVEQWKKDGNFRDAPRVYRRLARESVRAELRWRGGEPAESIQADLEKTRLELNDAMKKAGTIRRPTPQSVGQARAFDRSSDPALKEVKEVLGQSLRLRQPPPADPSELVKKVKEGLKDKVKTSLDLAMALVDAAEGQAFDAKALAFLDDIVEQCGLGRDVVELQFLHQLALRAKGSAPWPADLAQRAWNTVLAAEQANSRPDAFAWVRVDLDEADALLHRARVLLLPETANYESWDRIAAAWDDARAKYDAVARRQGAIRKGQATLSRALASLVDLVPYLEASPTSELQTDLLEAAELSGELARDLEPPTGPTPANEGALAALTTATDRLETLSRNLMAPFQSAAVRKIVERCRADGPADPALATQIEAMLVTPFLAVSDRRALYEAGRSLDGRLEKSWDPQKADAASAAAPGGRPDARAERRFQRMAAFLKLAGDATTSRTLEEVRKGIEQSSRRASSARTDLPWDMSDPAMVWSSMSRCAELTYDAFVRLLKPDATVDDLDRAGWVAPAYLPGFGNWETNPIRRGRERAYRDNWTWLAGHYRFESRDLNGLMDPDRMLERAAVEALGDAPDEPGVGLRFNGPPSPIRLSPRERTAAVKLELQLTGAGAPQKVVVDRIEPEYPRLEVSPPEPAAPEVSGSAPTTVAMELKLSEDTRPVQVPRPAGLLARAHTPDGRTYHAQVPLRIISADIDPTLALSRNPDVCDDVPIDPLRLRPIAGQQKFYVFVKNPSAQPRDVNVELELVRGKTLVAKVQAAPGTSTRVAGFGAPPANKLPELAGSYAAGVAPILRLKDADIVLDEQPIRAAIMSPRDYVEVSRVVYAPETPARPNKLTVVVGGLAALAGPACPVKLIPPAMVNAPKDAVLAGDLEPGKPPLTLSAQDFALKAPDAEEAEFHLDVDGIERVFRFRGRFPERGGEQKAEELREPRIRFRPSLPGLLDLVKRGEAPRLRVEFEVDDAPARARLAFRLLDRTGSGQGRGDRQLGPDTPAKDQHIGFDPGGEGGALLFEASSKDWVKEWPVPGILGSRTLQAKLLPDGRPNNPIKVEEKEMVFDERRPSGMSLELPERIGKGKDLKVRARVTPPASKITDATLIFGRETDFEKAVADGLAFKAAKKDADGGEWSATLPVQKDAPSKLIVTVRFTTGVGLTGFFSEQVAVIDEPRPEDMKAAAPKRGAIVGTIKEGDFPQPGLKVYLVDPLAPQNKNVLVTVTTDDNGTFTFKDLEPKEYRIYCKKDDGITPRDADFMVTVKSGQTEKVEAGLKLIQRR